MIPFSSYRRKLQAAFVALGLAAIAVTGFEASQGAVSALRKATYDRLNAIRQTRVRQIERYFEDVTKHVLALSSDESTIAALEEFQRAWPELPSTSAGSERYTALEAYYRSEFAPRIQGEPAAGTIERWLPEDPRARTLQYLYLAANPHPVRSKDLLLTAREAGRYGLAHARYHPTLHRYQSAFGFYDILLISAADHRILYTVFKETDLGMQLSDDPYRSTSLARANERALKVQTTDEVVIEDYQPYAASYFAPASFVAAPIWRAGTRIGVLAIQLSIHEINRVMIGTAAHADRGLGETGHAYIVGPDATLRSDLRVAIEHRAEYYEQLQKSGIAEAEKIRRHGTGVLNARLSAAAAANVLSGRPGVEEGVDDRGTPVLRSHSPLGSPELGWTVVAEISAQEAFAPVRALQFRILAIGAVIALVFLLAARWLARSVTRPVIGLAESARRLGSGDFGTRVTVETGDEIGQLAASFNRMAEDLERTTVSKQELEVLAGRLLTAQEQERSRIARELHDDITQRLAAIAIEAGRIERLAPEPADRWRSAVARIKQQLAQLSDDVHGVSWSLHPTTLEDLGLVAAIESECRRFFERGGPPVELVFENLPEKLPRSATLALFRIVQEALRNIERHAAAEDAAIRLRCDGNEVHLEIRDSGRGFDRAASSWRPGLGLASMEERVRLCNGRFVVVSQPGAGATISVTLPLGETDEEAESSAGR